MQITSFCAATTSHRCWATASPPLLSRLHTLLRSFFFSPAITLFSLALLSSVPPVHLTCFHSITVHLAWKKGPFLKRHPGSSGFMNELIKWRGVVEVLGTRGKPWAWPEPSLMTLEKRPALMSLTPRITPLSCEPMHCNACLSLMKCQMRIGSWLGEGFECSGSHSRLTSANFGSVDYARVVYFLKCLFFLTW